MRKLLTFAAFAMLLVGGSLVAGSVDTAQAIRSDRFDRRIEILNLTNITVREVNSTNVGRNDWGIDLLGRYVIRPGQSIVINVEDRTGYCRYDFRAIFETGHTVVRWRVNVCEVTRWTLTGRV